MPRHDERTEEGTRSPRRRYPSSRSPVPDRRYRDAEGSDRNPQGDRKSRKLEERNLNDYDSSNRRTTFRKRSYSPRSHSTRNQDSGRGRRDRTDEYDDRDSKRHRRHSRSSSLQHLKKRKSYSPLPLTKSKKPLPSQTDAFASEAPNSKETLPPEKQKPNFSNTGRLAAASNTITSSSGQTIVLKYHEPAEARKPSTKDAWRLYVFKGSEIVDTIELGLRSCWLFGREHAVVDIPTDHPSCSKQHAVVQFRYVEKRNEFGDRSGKVRPYVIDLESANGTSVAKEQLPAGRYVELKDGDVLRFGHSSREYVVQLPPAE